MKNILHIDAKSVFFGTAVLLATLILVSIIITVVTIARHLPPEEVPAFQAKWSVLLYIAPFFGGFIAAVRAKTNEVLNAFCVGAVAMLIFLGGFVAVAASFSDLSAISSEVKVGILEYGLSVVALAMLGGAARWAMRVTGVGRRKAA